ncbi:MAG: hypothetical protein PVH73_09025 [Candidatus Bathyarchaeota archaeon]
MNEKTKFLTILLVSVAACMLIYLPFTMALQPSSELGDEDVFAKMAEDGSCECGDILKLRLLWWFLNHSEPVEVEGTVVMLIDNKLVLSSGEEQIGVHLPEEWIVNGEVVTPQELFLSGYPSEGENVTVKALGADIIDKNGLRIYLLVGYEIINDAGVHAIANMPVNIET